VNKVVEQVIRKADAAAMKSNASMSPTRSMVKLSSLIRSALSTDVDFMVPTDVFPLRDLIIEQKPDLSI
jgi:hypothetical protein